MLVVMHDGDVQFFFKSAFYFETFRCLDIFQIDTTECWGNGFDSLNEFFWVFFVNLYVEYINTCIDFEQQTFSFHYRFSGHGADITQTEYGGTVGDDSYQITFGGIFVSILRVLFNFQTRFCYTRRVG